MPATGEAEQIGEERERIQPGAEARHLSLPPFCGPLWADTLLSGRLRGL